MWSLVSTGSPAVGASPTPTIPSFTPGQIGYMQSQAAGGTVPAPVGWTKVSPNINATVIAGWIRVLQSGDAGPTLNWGGLLSTAWIDVFSGPATVVNLIDDSIDTAGSSTSSINYSPLAIDMPGCLVIQAGMRIKTSTTDGKTFTALPGFTILNSSVTVGSGIAAVTNYAIQTNAASLGSQSQSFPADTSQPFRSFSVALVPLITQLPIPSGARQTFVSTHYIQF